MASVCINRCMTTENRQTEIEHLKTPLNAGISNTFPELKRNFNLHRSILKTEKKLKEDYLKSNASKLREGYRDLIPELLEKKGVKPTHFVTLIFNKNVTEEDCIDAYRVFLSLLGKKVYGKHNKRRHVKEVTVLERNASGHLHIHGLFECELENVKFTTEDDWKFHIKNIWDKRIKKGSRIGINERSKYFVKVFEDDIYDKDKLHRYITKNISNDRGQLIV